MNEADAEALPWALGRPVVTGTIRAELTDFQVDEKLGFTADGDGEHQLVQVEKRGLDTTAVARELARFCGVPTRDVAFAGRKDRHAVTTQWFTVRVGATRAPDWSTFSHGAVRICTAAAHRRKLRRGALEANRFRLRVTALAGPVEDLELRLQRIAVQGVPNYFGPQRYGREGANLARARRWFARGRAPRGRDERSFALSAARSYLFDRYLGERVAAGTWNAPHDGERLILDGSRSFFVAEAVDPTLADRVASGDVHPSGPLWGRGCPSGAGAEGAAEARLAGVEQALCEGLERHGLKAGRRALRAVPRALRWTLEPEVLTLEFELPSGSYATTLLRELVRV